VPLRARTGLAALALVLPGMASSACGTAGPTVVEIASPPATVTPLPRGTAEPEDASQTSGCVWSGGALRGRDELPLCFEKEGACFASASSPFEGTVRMWLPPGDPARTGARLDLGADGLRVRAWTDADLVLLHPAAPTALGRIAIPVDAEQIRVGQLIDRTLELSLRAIRGLSPREGALRARVPCAEVALEHKSYSDEAIRGLIGAGPSLGERTLPARQSLSIAAEASGRAVADVTPESGDSRVELLEQSGGRSRIVWWRDDVVLFGWVDQAALGPAPTGPVYADGPMNATGRLVPVHPKGTRCDRELSLFAQVHEARQKVGVIEKGTVFDRSLPTADGVFVSVELRTTAFQTAQGSYFLVPAAALARCE
jgi:hypothetical protein